MGVRGDARAMPQGASRSARRMDGAQACISGTHPRVGNSYSKANSRNRALAGMPRAISWRKFVRRLRTLGFDGPYSGGRHLFMVRGTLTLHISNPHEGDISRHLLSEILRQAGISSKEWKKAE